MKKKIFFLRGFWLRGFRRNSEGILAEGISARGLWLRGFRRGDFVPHRQNAHYLEKEQASTYGIEDQFLEFFG